MTWGKYLLKQEVFTPSTLIYFDIKVSGEQLQRDLKMTSVCVPVPDVCLGRAHIF